MTRREFVRASATAAAGTLLVPGFVHAAGSDTIRVGLIGCGGRGTGAAWQALSADRGAVLWAMADLFEDRITSSLERLTAQAGDTAAQRIQVSPERRFVGFDAYRQLIAADVQVVILATAPHFRPAHLEAAVAAGTHIFCEKPMAVDAPGVRRVMEAGLEAQRRGLSVVSGFCWRYSDAERETYRRIREGQIGRVVSVHTTYHTGPLGGHPRQPGWSDMEWQLRNWWHFRWLSGDHIVEQACHSVDKINWAMDGRPPLCATAIGGRFMREGPESGNVYDHFTVIYEYDDAVRCFHTCRQMPNCSGDNSDYLMGTEGTCFVNGWKPRHVIRGRRPWEYTGQRRDMYQVEHDELFASIRNDLHVNDGQWMAQSTMMSIMGRMAAYTGKTITWEEALNAQEDWTPAEYAFGPLDVPAVAKPGQYTIPTSPA
jgi:predicted dehydrogenase